MLRKMFSLGALVVVAVTFGVGSAAAKPDKPSKPGASSPSFQQDGFSDGRMSSWSSEGFSDGRS
jgi:hypothetical protein